MSGLLGSDAAPKNAVSNAAGSLWDRAVRWMSVPAGEWGERAVNLGLDVGGSFLGIPGGFPGRVDYYNAENGGFNRLGDVYQPPFQRATNFLGGLFNGGARGAPLPQWLQPNAPMDGNAPWQQAPPNAWDTPGEVPRYSWEEDYGGESERPYGDGAGMFPQAPSGGPSYQGNRSAGNVAGTIEGQAARDYVAGMQSPVARNAQLAAQAQAAMERMFGRQYR